MVDVIKKDKSLNSNRFYFCYYDEKKEIADNLGYDFVDDAIVDFYTGWNKSLREIGEIFNCDRKTIALRLKQLGIKRKPKGGKKRMFSKEIEEEIKSNSELYSRKELSIQYGCNISTIRNVLTDYKINLCKKRGKVE